MIRLLTAGESHGPGLTVILDGLPAGIPYDSESVDRELSRRQHGYGRGGRMRIEKDKVQVLAGIRGGRTTGAPVSFFIANMDHENWRAVMDLGKTRIADQVTRPRPGHADLSGALKYNHADLRDILERASARETAGRVAAGGLLKIFLRELEVEIFSQTIAIAGIRVRKRGESIQRLDRSPLRCRDVARERMMIRLIDRARTKGDTLGGVTEITARGVCPGLGSHVQFDRRLDGRIGMAMLSIPSVKGIEIGDAWENARHYGSSVQDEIFYRTGRGFFRKTNRGGGIEGGITNGLPLVVRLAIKPIPTLARPLRSVDLKTKRPALGHRERADLCAVPAVGVIAETMLALVLADAYLEKFGQDCLADIKASYRRYCRRIKK
jgi:chorismate synthase